MKEIKTIEQYMESLTPERKEIIQRIRNILNHSLPKGFEEVFMYNMITYVVPLKTYPKGYLNQKDIPLPFISLASQKNHIALYHMGIYMNKPVLRWFEDAYSEQVNHKLDMGKSCIRFKKKNDIPYDLIKILATKMTPEEFIRLYESLRK